jgi:hypothetical protein
MFQHSLVNHESTAHPRIRLTRTDPFTRDNHNNITKNAAPTFFFISKIQSKCCTNFQARKAMLLYN